MHVPATLVAHLEQGIVLGVSAVDEGTCWEAVKPSHHECVTLKLAQGFLL